MKINYPEEKLDAACHHVSCGTSFAKAALRYHLPRSTLYDYWKARGCKRRSTLRKEAELKDYYSLTPGGRGDKLAQKFARGKL